MLNIWIVIGIPNQKLRNAMQLFY